MSRARSDRTSCQVTVTRFYRFSLALELRDSPANRKWNLCFYELHSSSPPASHSPDRKHDVHGSILRITHRFLPNSLLVWIIAACNTITVTVSSSAHAWNLSVVTAVRNSSNRAVHASWVGSLIYPRQTSIHHNSRPIARPAVPAMVPWLYIRRSPDCRVQTASFTRRT